MYRFSFKIQHKDCAETALSMKFKKHFITVVDIQSRNQKEKQYLYSVKGNAKQFDAFISFLKKNNSYKIVQEIERSTDCLVLLIFFRQESYVQNIIQKYHGFFLDHHTVFEGYEYYHVGALEKKNILSMIKELRKIGVLKTLFIGAVDFSQPLLSKQQKKIFSYAMQQGYYELPRKTTIVRIAKALQLSSATAGEHLLKAENKMLGSMIGKI